MTCFLMRMMMMIMMMMIKGAKLGKELTKQ